MRETYNFNSVIDGLYEASAGMTKPADHTDKAAQGRQLAQMIAHVFPLDGLSHFTARYLEGDFRALYKESLSGHKMPTSAERYSGIDSYSSYRQPPKPGMEGFRPANEYMLTEGESKQADSALRRMPLMQETVSAMQSVLVAYCNGLMRANYATMQGRDLAAYDTVSGILNTALKFASTFTMRYDLMPVIALAVEQSGWQRGDSLTDDHFRRGLGLAFSTQTFRTVDMSARNPERKESRCPFSPIIAKWMAKSPVMQVDGHIEFRTEDRQGALPAFIASRITALNAQTVYIPETFDI